MPGAARAFKTAWFTKAARKAGIGDDELCEAFQETLTTLLGIPVGIIATILMLPFLILFFPILFLIFGAAML